MTKEAVRNRTTPPPKQEAVTFTELAFMIVTMQNLMLGGMDQDEALKRTDNALVSARRLVKELSQPQPQNALISAHQLVKDLTPPQNAKPGEVVKTEENDRASVVARRKADKGYESAFSGFIKKIKGR